MVGVLVARRKYDPIDRHFDVRGERVLFMNDWYHRESSTVDAELKGLLWKSDLHFPDYESALINGRNVFPCNMVRRILTSPFPFAYFLSSPLPSSLHPPPLFHSPLHLLI